MLLLALLVAACTHPVATRDAPVDAGPSEPDAFVHHPHTYYICVSHVRILAEGRCEENLIPRPLGRKRPSGMSDEDCLEIWMESAPGYRGLRERCLTEKDPLPL